MRQKTDTIIIGSGLAGLTAAYYLQQAGKPYLLLEASDRVGGRVKTDHKNGYLLDRGFQVFLTAYPEAKAVLDYAALDLREFAPGAVLFRDGGKKDYIGDPQRQLSALLPTVLTSAGTVFDKVKILMTKQKVTEKSIAEIFASNEFETSTVLRTTYGFSEQLISAFLKPFYAGIFLEQDLTTSRRMFDFVFKMFSEGSATLPAGGMEEIPKQIASHLDPQSVRLQSEVQSVEGSSVTLADGSVLEAKHILLATEATGLASRVAKVKQERRSTTNIYFESEARPFARKAIALSSTPTGIVNNMTSMTNVASQYSPAGKHLISVSLRQGAAYQGASTHQAVKAELKPYIPTAANWQHLHTYEIDYALPDQTQITNDDIQPVSTHTMIIGDHMLNGSINAAMKSGRLGAEWVMGK